MLRQAPSGRRRCGRCQRPQSHCLCAHIPLIANRTRVFVLQHPDEAKHPLNTARLAVLGLTQAELRIGEHFPELERLIGSVTRAWLLFPANEQNPPATLPRPPAVTPLTAQAVGTEAAPGRLKAQDGSLLIVPDGTWRKARQIIRANPPLATLPRVSLPAGPPSTYRVRRAREADAVSTIEAVVRALSLMEPGQDFSPLLKPFDVLVQQQIEAMGEAVYRRNYG